MYLSIFQQVRIGPEARNPNVESWTVISFDGIRKYEKQYGGNISEFSRKLIIIVNFSMAQLSLGSRAFLLLPRIFTFQTPLVTRIIIAFINEALRIERINDTMRVGNHPGWCAQTGKREVSRCRLVAPRSRFQIGHARLNGRRRSKFYQPRIASFSIRKSNLPRQLKCHPARLSCLS